MKTFVATFVFGILAAICPLHASEPGLAPLISALQTKWPKNRTINLVFHGHSVPAGYQKTPDVRPFEAYPHLFDVKLKERYPYAVVNVIVTAIGGEDSVAGAARFDRDVLPLKPDLVFIDYALNDRRKSLDQVEAAWKAMVTSAKKNGVPVVLITPTGDSTADLSKAEDPLRQRADLIRRIAKEENVLLADVSAAWVAEIAKGTPQTELLSQVNHPNLRGHQLAAGALFDCFTTAGKLR